MASPGLHSQVVIELLAPCSPARSTQGPHRSSSPANSPWFWSLHGKGGAGVVDTGCLCAPALQLFTLPHAAPVAFCSAGFSPGLLSPCSAAAPSASTPAPSGRETVLRSSATLPTPCAMLCQVWAHTNADRLSTESSPLCLSLTA